MVFSLLSLVNLTKMHQVVSRKYPISMKLKTHKHSIMEILLSVEENTTGQSHKAKNFTNHESLLALLDIAFQTEFI